MTDKLGKKFSVQFEPEVDHFLTELAKEKGKPKAQLIRELVVEGLLSEKINEVRESFDDAIEKIEILSKKKEAEESVTMKLLTGILGNVAQILLAQRKGMSEEEVSRIRFQADKYVSDITKEK